MSSPATYATPLYEVILLSAGTAPERVAKAIVANTDRRKKEALELIRAAPVTIIEGAGSATAEGAREAMEAAGASVEVRAYEEENAPLPAQSAPLTGGQKALVIILIAIAIILALLLLMSFIQSMNDFLSM
jgi:Ribosomal protein L7/L12 C-terminal domain